MGRRGHFTRDQTIAPGNRAQKRHYTTGTDGGVPTKGHGAGWCSEEVAGSQQDTRRRVRTLLRHQYSDRCRVAGFLGRVRVCCGEQLFAHTDARALLFPLGLACTRRRRRLVRTILQHCFLRRGITQRKFPTKLRKHFFFPRRARGRHDGCFAPPAKSTTSWNPAFPDNSPRN